MVKLFAVLIAAIAFAAQPLHAADIAIALSADVTSMDPHFHNLTPNNDAGNHVFETLVAKNAKWQLVPALERTIATEFRQQ